MGCQDVLAYGNRLRSTQCKEFHFCNHAVLLTSIELRNYYLTLAMCSGRICILHIVSFNLMTPQQHYFPYVGWHAGSLFQDARCCSHMWTWLSFTQSLTYAELLLYYILVCNSIILVVRQYFCLFVWLSDSLHVGFFFSSLFFLICQLDK